MNHGKLYDFSWLEERLLPLGFRLVFLTRSPESFAQAREERLRVSGKPSQYDNLDIFIAEQVQLKELVAQSKLPVLHLDISDSNVARAADAVAAWLRDTGGLYLPD